MRIISGSLKGKKIVAPDNLPVRPTTDYAKESLFNILNNHFYFEYVTALDCFSGTGNISYELLSRGVQSVLSVDKDQHCFNFQKLMKTELKLGSNFNILQKDVFVALTTIDKKFDLIFCDPPYDLPQINELPKLVFKHRLLNDDGLLIVEHSKATSFKSEHFFQTRKYGKVNFSIFKNT